MSVVKVANATVAMILNQKVEFYMGNTDDPE